MEDLTKFRTAFCRSEAVEPPAPAAPPNTGAFEKICVNKKKTQKLFFFLHLIRVGDTSCSCSSWCFSSFGQRSKAVKQVNISGQELVVNGLLWIGSGDDFESKNGSLFLKLAHVADDLDAHVRNKVGLALARVEPLADVDGAGGVLDDERDVGGELGDALDGAHHRDLIEFLAVHRKGVVLVLLLGCVDLRNRHRSQTLRRGSALVLHTLASEKPVSQNLPLPETRQKKKREREKKKKKNKKRQKKKGGKRVEAKKLFVFVLFFSLLFLLFFSLHLVVLRALVGGRSGGGSSAEASGGGGREPSGASVEALKTNVTQKHAQRHTQKKTRQNFAQKRQKKKKKKKKVGRESLTPYEVGA